ncbi:contractile injection system tape measure protein [Akkermansia glycaniphila]|uniref:Uncharacterized protein n=1 Tax=Akkermansia glycaniphila TaxID=1679444 RepID=A0A1H6LDI8_9BACT|nr:contractile injection system tape measure protein [Akkermansia glycaniphila]SEH86509.1 Hypothetical protein PYTT_1301 [Akkermansia glycaniphila]
MITVDRLSFQFVADNETFAADLYAGWDDFCRRCFTEVLDDFLSGFDGRDELIEVDSLTLNLGRMEEEELLTVFPVRVREELERVFRPGTMQRIFGRELAKRRLENLLFYLSCGVCKPEWHDGRFDMREELAFIIQHAPDALALLMRSCFQEARRMERLLSGADGRQFGILATAWNDCRQIGQDDRQRMLASLATARPGLMAGFLEAVQGDAELLRRLAACLNAGLDADRTLAESTRTAVRMKLVERMPENLRPLLLAQWAGSMFWLSSPAISHFEKQRYLAAVLESSPEIVVRFIHESGGDMLPALAELLDSLTVKRIMVEECESHAEVDVPPYWHYLYNWFLENYPFNGVYSFGDKKQFRQHLNVKFLSFIRKRMDAAYLSKAELTVQFLLEVFGREYYLDVLDVLYRRQPLHADGTPVDGGYFNMELYHMFMRLSLLRFPAKRSGAVSSPLQDGLPRRLETQFAEMVADESLPVEQRRQYLAACFREEPRGTEAMLCALLRRKGMFRLVAELADREMLYVLLSLSSLRACELARQTVWAMEHPASGTGAMAASGREVSAWSVKKGLLYFWLHHAGRSAGPEEEVGILVSAFLDGLDEEGNPLPEMKSGEEHVFRSLQVVARALHLNVFNEWIYENGGNILPPSEQEWPENAVPDERLFSRLHAILTHERPGKEERRMLLAAYLEACQTSWPQMLLELRRNGLLHRFAELGGHPLMMSMAEFLFESMGNERLRQVKVLYRWMCASSAVRELMADSSQAGMDARILAVLAQWTESGVFATLVPEALCRRFMCALVGESGYEEALLLLEKHLTGKTARKNADRGVADGDLWKILIRSLHSHTQGNASSSQGIVSGESMGIVEESGEVEYSVAECGHDVRLIAEMSGTSEEKERLLRKLVDSDSAALLPALESFSRDEDAFRRLAGALPYSDLMKVFGSIVPERKELLSRAAEAIMRSGGKQYGVAAAGRAEWEAWLGQALLLWLVEGKALLLRTWSHEEMVRQLVGNLHRIADGRIEREKSGSTDMEASRQDVGRLLDELNLRPIDGHESMLSSETASVASLHAGRLLAWLKDEEVSAGEKKRILAIHAEECPGALVEVVLQCVGGSSDRGICEWMDTRSLVGLIARISLAKAEMLNQIIERLRERHSVSEQTLKRGLLEMLLRIKNDYSRQMTADSLAKLFLQFMLSEEEAQPSEQQPINNKQMDSKNITTESILGELSVSPSEDQATVSPTMEDVKYLTVHNAGLVLLVPWFRRLFSMLGLLNEEMGDFKNTESRIRAIFILQYLVTGQNTEYEEQELAFNRVLAECPFSCPLPKSLELTPHEMETAASMMEGVMANWEKLKNTSVQGFRNAFIARSGRLEQLEEKWLLTVDQRAYDMLLDSLPWSYKMIRFPWLKKMIIVEWRNV